MKGLGPQVDHHYREAMCKCLVAVFVFFIGGSKCIDRLNHASEWNTFHKVSWETYISEEAYSSGDCVLFKKTVDKYVISYECEQVKE